MKITNNFIEGFVAECYNKGLTEKQASWLLDRYIAEGNGEIMEKSAAGKSIINLLLLLLTLGAGAYGLDHLGGTNTAIGKWLKNTLGAGNWGVKDTLNGLFNPAAMHAAPAAQGGGNKPVATTTPAAAPTPDAPAAPPTTDTPAAPPTPDAPAAPPTTDTPAAPPTTETSETPTEDADAKPVANATATTAAPVATDGQGADAKPVAPGGQGAADKTSAVANKENVVAPTVNDTDKDVNNPTNGVQPRAITNPGAFLPR